MYTSSMKEEKDDLLLGIGTMLRGSRQKKELTQKVVAEKAGINEKHLGRIERGESNVKIKTLELLCKELEVSLPNFFQKALRYKKAIVDARKGIYLPQMDLIKKKKT
ncbi:MAG: XRE family transcriptional regulator [Candidatus Cloacimonadota bacterium]|nr:MAG: XRE family transcriptional regulator [Candidatus Cloacimonadota bacterium]